MISICICFPPPSPSHSFFTPTLFLPLFPQQSKYMDQARPARSNVYAFNGQMLAVAAIATVFFFVFLLVSLHLYARWWLRRAAASRRRTHVVVLSDPGSAADLGLDPAVLASLPVFTFSSKSTETETEQGRALLECAVCLSEFEEEEAVRLLPRCNHAFHIECIDMWFHSHSTCPLCRSPVEPQAPESVVSEAEPGPSSGCDLCATCQHAERGVENGSTASFRRRKAMDVRIDVGPAEFESELTPGHGSPVTRLSSFKRLLSMRMKSPIGGRASPRNGAAGTSRAATELDLEGGLGEPIRVRTPK